MMQGIVEKIFIAHRKGEPTISMDQVNLVPGRGIEGDRYFQSAGNSDGSVKPDRELTMIEIEAIEYMVEVDGLQITPDQTRRNIVTRGIAVNDLVSCEFQIGNVRLRGIRLCEPCKYLADRTDPRILQSMVHRGGLRVEFLSEGIIHVNDIITTSCKENL